MEVINDLLNYKDMKIIQRKDGFNFSLDSVLLANFVSLNKNTSKVVDLGTGNAPIPLIMSTRTAADIIGVEIQDVSFDLAKRSVAMNQLENRINIMQGDLKTISDEIGFERYDVVTCNPPFFKVKHDSHLNESDYKTIARHEVLATLDDVVNTAKLLLRNGGYFAMVHRPERLADIITAFKQHNIEPKRIQFIHPKPGKEANILLIEGKKDGNAGLKVLTPEYSHNGDGSYTDFITSQFSERND